MRRVWSLSLPSCCIIGGKEDGAPLIHLPPQLAALFSPRGGRRATYCRRWRLTTNLGGRSLTRFYRLAVRVSCQPLPVLSHASLSNYATGFGTFRPVKSCGSCCFPLLRLRISLATTRRQLHCDATVHLPLSLLDHLERGNFAHEYQGIVGHGSLICSRCPPQRRQRNSAGREAIRQVEISRETKWHLGWVACYICLAQQTQRSDLPTVTSGTPARITDPRHDSQQPCFSCPFQGG